MRTLRKIIAEMKVLVRARRNRADLVKYLIRRPAILAEIAAAIAWENHRSRINRALGVRAAGFSDGAFCVLPER